MAVSRIAFDIHVEEGKEKEAAKTRNKFEDAVDQLAIEKIKAMHSDWYIDPKKKTAETMNKLTPILKGKGKIVFSRIVKKTFINNTRGFDQKDIDWLKQRLED